MPFPQDAEASSRSAVMSRDKSTGGSSKAPSWASGLLATSPPAKAGVDPQSAMSLLKGQGRVRKEGEPPLIRDRLQDYTPPPADEPPLTITSLSCPDSEHPDSEPSKSCWRGSERERKRKRKRRARSATPIRGKAQTQRTNRQTQSFEGLRCTRRFSGKKGSSFCDAYFQVRDKGGSSDWSRQKGFPLSGIRERGCVCKRPQAPCHSVVASR